MKKNLLTLAVAGAVAASAQAQMHVDPDNTGEVLIYPFYSADNGNQTYIHVVNTTDQWKAAKVRMLEAENSMEVRDFNLYLSPYDHFAFTIKLDESGAAKLATSDTSCTAPQIPEGGIEFTNKLYLEAKDANTSLERTLNGYVEVIEMGQFKGSTSADPGYLWDHNGTGTPRDCAGVEKLWLSGGDWAADRANNTGALALLGTTGALSASKWQGGGLYGMGIIVNPEAGAAVGYDAVAVDGFVDPASHGASLHYFPGNVDPSLEGNTNTAKTTTVFDNGTATVYTLGNTLDAVSAMLMVDTVSNDYVLDEGFGGKTDWVVTFPTKRKYVENGDTTVGQAADPFYIEWDTDKSCDPYRIKHWDREENTPQGPSGVLNFSPYDDPDVEDAAICYEANILTFAQVDEAVHESPLLGAEPSASGKRIQTEIDVAYENGWAKIDFDFDSLIGTTYKWDSHTMTATGPNGTVTMKGLPTVGFSVIRFGNNTLSGGTVLANYAAAHEHKMSRSTS